jgi:hypothetical protein
LKNLKFLDGYAAGFRRSVNLKTSKFSGLKSHDYHIIMERLLPIMFHGFVKNDVWKALAELSYFSWFCLVASLSPPPLGSIIAMVFVARLATHRH